MSYLGDFALSSILDFKFTTVDSSGAPTAMAGSPAISVYKDNSTTQSTSGVTLSTSFDSVTGLNNVRIDTSSDGTFYSAGSNFQVIITTGTVDSVSIVGYVIGSFSLNHRSALRPTTAGRTLDVSSGGEAGIDWANVGSPSTTVGLSGTTVKTATDVETATTNIQGRIPTSLVSGRMNSNVDAINDSAAAADNLEAGARASVRTTVEDSAFTSTTTQFEIPVVTPDEDFFVNRVVVFWSGALAGQAVSIAASEVSGSFTKLTVSPLTQAPVDGDNLIIV